MVVKNISINFQTDIVITDNEIKIEEESGKKNLDSLLNLLGFDALVEIGDHAEAAAVVLDESDGGSPSAEGFDGGIFVLELEILEESFLHIQWNWNRNQKEEKKRC